MQALLPIIFGVIPYIITEAAILFKISILGALSITSAIGVWQNALHPLICFIYIRSLRSALCGILKPINAVTSTTGDGKAFKNVVYVS